MCAEFAPGHPLEDAEEDDKTERNLRPRGKRRYRLVTLIASRHGRMGSASEAADPVRDGDTEE